MHLSSHIFFFLHLSLFCIVFICLCFKAVKASISTLVFTSKVYQSVYIICNTCYLHVLVKSWVWSIDGNLADVVLIF